MDFPDIINWRNPFKILGLFDSKFKFHSNFKSSFCKQTVKNLICGVWSGSALFADVPQKEC